MYYNAIYQVQRLVTKTTYVNNVDTLGISEFVLAEWGSHITALVVSGVEPLTSQYTV